MQRTYQIVMVILAVVSVLSFVGATTVQTDIKNVQATGTVQPQFNGTSISDTNNSHYMHAFPIILNNSQAQTAQSSGGTTDQQLGETFTGNWTSISYNITAVEQTDASGAGPAYLLNGYSNKDYWYQDGLSYDWPGSSGFRFIYCGFDNKNNIAYGENTGYTLPFSGKVNQGDKVTVSMYFSGGNVVMTAYDWNTSASASFSYSAENATYFMGTSSNTAYLNKYYQNTYSNNYGFFTGLMTEQYHYNGRYNGTEQPVTYIANGQGVTSARMMIDDLIPSGAGAWPKICSRTQNMSSPCPLINFTTSGALNQISFVNSTEYANATEFITGNYPFLVENSTYTITADQGAQVTISANANSYAGTAPYTYTWYMLLPGSSAYSCLGSNSIGCITTPNAYTNEFAQGTYLFKFGVTDSPSQWHNSGFAMSKPITLTVYSDPNVSIKSPSYEMIDQGQKASLSSNATGGLAPYTYSWRYSKPLSEKTIGVVSNGNSYLFPTTKSTVVGAYYFASGVKDSSQFPYSAWSNNVIVQVSAAPKASLIPSQQRIALGSSDTYTVTVTGGTGPFEVELFENTNKQAVSNVLIGSPGGSNTIIFNPLTSGTIRYVAVATDLGTTTPYEFNSLVNTIIVSKPVGLISAFNLT